MHCTADAVTMVIRSGHYLEIKSNRRHECLMSVLAQQTVFGFSEKPPSPWGSKRLPSCVVEERGGEDRFAMAQRTQLLFNLDHPADHRNLETNFKPQPSPVVVEKVIPQGQPAVSLPITQHFTALSSERLAMALRLARRDLRLGLVQGPNPSSRPANGGGVSNKTEGKHSSATASVARGWKASRVDKAVSPAKHLPATARVLSDKLPEHNAPIQTARATDKKQQQVSGPSADDSKTAMEGLARLRKELKTQAMKLKHLSEYRDAVRQRTPAVFGNGAHGAGGGKSGRVAWEEEEPEEERERRRGEEQAARNARMLYQLQQQVSSLKDDVSFKQPRHTKKSRAVHRLALAHRAAIRTLQNYLSSSAVGDGENSNNSSSNRHCSQLVSIVQQLTQLCAQMGCGGEGEEEEGGRQLDELLEHLKTLERRSIGVKSSQHQPLPVNGENTPPDSPPPPMAHHTTQTHSKRLGMPKQFRNQTKSRRGIKGTKTWKRGASPTGVLLTPMRRGRNRNKGRRRGGGGKHRNASPHFIQQTYSSLLKQSPKVTRSAPKPKSPSHAKSLDTRGSSPMAAANFTSDAAAIGKARRTRVRTVHFPDGTDLEEREERFGGEARPYHVIIRSEDASDVEEGGDTSGEAKAPARRKRISQGVCGSPRSRDQTNGGYAQPRDSGKLGSEGVPESCEHQQLTCCGSHYRQCACGHSKDIGGYGTSSRGGGRGVGGGGGGGGGGQQRSLTDRLSEMALQSAARRSDAVADMLLDDVLEDTARECQRLEDMEDLEQQARSLLVKPDLSVMAERIKEMEAEEERIRQKWTTVTYESRARSRYTDDSQGRAPSTRAHTLPPQLLSSIQVHKRERESYLKATGVVESSKFDPWGFVESVADDLLEEILGQVTEELEAVCDGFVEHLYGAEFTPES